MRLKGGPKMIEEPKLLTVARDRRRPTDKQIAGFQGMPTGFVVDAMFGAGQFSTDIKPLSEMEDAHIAGPALTIENSPGDILALLGGLKFIEDGAVVVNAFGAFQGVASAGDRVSAMMKNCGAAGFVSDGPMRDHEGLMKVGLPTWCTGLNPGSPHTKGPGRIGLPINLGGQGIETGDMIIADRNGVVVVPFDKIDATLTMLVKVAELEHALDAELEGGMDIPQDILDLMDSDQIGWE